MRRQQSLFPNNPMELRQLRYTAAGEALLALIRLVLVEVTV
jgi:hypothetical protein